MITVQKTAFKNHRYINRCVCYVLARIFFPTPSQLSFSVTLTHCILRHAIKECVFLYPRHFYFPCYILALSVLPAFFRHVNQTARTTHSINSTYYFHYKVYIISYRITLTSLKNVNLELNSGDF